MSTGNQLLAKLQQMKAERCSHSDMIRTAMSADHKGFDISEDQTMIIVHFNGTKVIIAPYHEVYLVDTTH